MSAARNKRVLIAAALVAGLVAAALGLRALVDERPGGEALVPAAPRQPGPDADESRADPGERVAAMEAVEVEPASADGVPVGRLRVHGSVVDRAFPPRGWVEGPAAGVSVRVRVAADEHELTTDAQGRFELELGDAGDRPLHVRALAAGDEERRVALVDTMLEIGQRELELRLEREAHGGLQGRTVDERGRGLAGVRVVFERGGADPLEALSGFDGRFELAWLGAGSWRPRAQLAGYALLCSSALRRGEEGGWRPVVLTLVPAGSLTVRVDGPEGLPAEGVTVGVGLDDTGAPDEADTAWADVRDAWARRDGRHLFQLVRRDETGPDGLVRLDEVWAGRRLALVVSGAGRWRVSTRHVGGEIGFDEDAATGEAIVVPVGRTLELRVVPYGARRRLVGSVSLADGSAVSRATVVVTPLDRAQEEAFIVRVRGERDGRFERELIDLRAGERLRVRATDGNPYSPESGERHGAVELVVGDGDLRADLVLEPMLALGGRLLDSAGRPVNAWLNARAEPPAHPAAEPREVFTREEGRFEVLGLAPGTYELVVHRILPIGTSVVRFPGLRAGARDLDLVLDEPLDVGLAVRLVAPRPIADWRLLIAMPSTTGPGPVLAPRAGARTVLAEAGWPEGACIDCSGSMPVRIDGVAFRGYIQRGKGQGDPLEQRFEGLPRGVLAVGVDAEDESGHPFVPLLAPPALYGPGTHELVFQLAPSAAISGRLTGTDPSRELALAVRDGQGRRLPLFDPDQRTLLAWPLGGDGRFDLPRLPSGELRLEVGPPADLEAGAAAAAWTRTLAPGETASVELEWP